MINRSYIHAYDNVDKYENIINEDITYIEYTLDEIKYYEQKIDNLLFIEGAESENVLLYTEGVSELIKSVGNRILDIIKRINKFFSDTIKNIKDLCWNKKDTIDKIKAEVNEDPAKASKKIHNLISEGKLSVDDFRSLAGYYKEVDNVLDQLKKDSADPKSLMAKIDKAEDRFNKAKKGLLLGAEIAGAALTVHKFIQIFQKNDPLKDGTLKDASEITERELFKIREMNSGLNSTDPNDVDALKRCRTKASVLAHASASVERTSNGFVRRRTKATAALWGMTDKVLKVCHAGSNDALTKTRNDYSTRERAVENRLNGMNNSVRAGVAARQPVKPSSPPPVNNINITNKTPNNINVTVKKQKNKPKP